MDPLVVLQLMVEYTVLTCPVFKIPPLLMVHEHPPPVCVEPELLINALLETVNVVALIIDVM